MENKILELLKDSGAFLEGHFLLTSGKHSNIYIEKFRLMESPNHLNTICKIKLILFWVLLLEVFYYLQELQNI